MSPGGQPPPRYAQLEEVGRGSGGRFLPRCACSGRLGGAHVHGWGTEEQEFAVQPQARTLKAQSRAASGGRAEEMGPQEGHRAGASEGHLGEETGSL